jgi:hypothetical protein
MFLVVLMYFQDFFSNLIQGGKKLPFSISLFPEHSGIQISQGKMFDELGL